MVTSCAALKCKHRSGAVDRNGKKITFHRFPKDKEIRKTWCIAVRRLTADRKPWQPSTTSVLCSVHFTESCFDRTGQTVRLRDKAVPTEFDYPSHRKCKVQLRTTRNSLKASQPESVGHQHDAPLSRSLRSSAGNTKGTHKAPQNSIPHETENLSQANASEAKEGTNMALQNQEPDETENPCQAERDTHMSPQHQRSQETEIANQAEEHLYACNPIKVKRSLGDSLEREDRLRKKLQNSFRHIRRLESKLEIIQKELDAEREQTATLTRKLQAYSYMPMELFQKPATQYTDTQREFARQLYLCSPDAYKFLRQHGITLPSLKTLRRPPSGTLTEENSNPD